ncbi:protein tyrosine phosphatase [Leclercia sp. 29361]|jgi:protein-tyrosine phosphatase|uniref:arsenate reductase/protein-tyrosine-phosphatase family protein n=1 Tax=Leclercia TaxID=83654 RepID=UPI000D13C22F|nr:MULTISPECIES: protein tyrosine phosphatase [Leclercia]MCU6683015.1 protein tyrosine phosphatase [Leclercia tamurae]MDY0922244.1 protein tyrosine phosphatase [Leclercia sp. CFBP8987]PSS46888.1 protein tyrosine phosphatase [Enterobacter sp. FS01]QIK14660.1 protein tyrosine phosphatase [Leclercia sp. 29361]
MIQSILVVCTGNICRSPLGERLLQQQLPALSIASAGICGLAGHPADRHAQQIAAMYGLSLADHVARPLTAAMMREYDLILAMESGQINRISLIAPEARGKALLYGQWLREQEIPDPYGKGMEAFEYVFRLLGEASQEWTNRLTVKGLRSCRRKT